MIVCTAERRFAVVQVLRSEEAEEVSVCRDIQDGDTLFLLVRVRDPALRQSLLPMLVRQQSNPAFEDFLGLFTQDGDLYARFRYTQAPTLEERLAGEKLRLRERLEIGSGLLGRMTLLNMPAPLQYEALRAENVTVDDALRVRFNYVLRPVQNCGQIGMSFVCLQIQELLQRLFAPELQARAVPELEAYLAALEQSQFATYLELYSGYDRVRQALEGRMVSDAAEPRTWLFRLWARIRGWKRFVRPLVAGLVVVAAFCYLIYTLRAPATLKGTPITFDQIGTVEIRSGK